MNDTISWATLSHYKKQTRAYVSLSELGNLVRKSSRSAAMLRYCGVASHCIGNSSLRGLERVGLTFLEPVPDAASPLTSSGVSFWLVTEVTPITCKLNLLYVL